MVLVEHYILKLRHLEIMKSRLSSDFERFVGEVDK